MENSNATYERLPRDVPYSTFFTDPQVETQSSSVTLTGCLWQRALVLMANESLSSAVSNNVSGIESDRTATQKQRNTALIQLLRSWRNGNEEEQRDTWQHLKQTLDEDRLSDRKLFS